MYVNLIILLTDLPCVCRILLRIKHLYLKDFHQNLQVQVNLIIGHPTSSQSVSVLFMVVPVSSLIF